MSDIVWKYGDQTTTVPTHLPVSVREVLYEREEARLLRKERSIFVLKFPVHVVHVWSLRCGNGTKDEVGKGLRPWVQLLQADGGLPL